jgi:flagellar motility protein MotE (MotC chaperone)
MRGIRAVAIAALVAKMLVLGAWWRVAAAKSDASPAKSEASAAEARSPARAADTGVPGDLFARSRGFRDLLEAVRQRGSDLDEREQGIAAREGALKSLEKTIADEITRLEGLAGGGGATPPAAGEGVAAAAPAPASAGPALTKIYETMKPEEAGPILDRLDDPTLIAIVGRMKERQLGAILAAMNRDRAVTVTQALAARQRGGVPR